MVLDSLFFAFPGRFPPVFRLLSRYVAPLFAFFVTEGWIHTRNGNYIRGTVAGHGVVPIRKCLQILKNAGYQGVVSYEFEGHEQNLPALKNALKFIRKAAE